MKYPSMHHAIPKVGTWEIDVLSTPLPSGDLMMFVHDSATGCVLAKGFRSGPESMRITQILDMTVEKWGLPSYIRTDYSKEFDDLEFQNWLFVNQVQHFKVRPHLPTMKIREGRIIVA